MFALADVRLRTDVGLLNMSIVLIWAAKIPETVCFQV